ncbi:cell division topological specificity factor MinE, putative [Synechococcus sp. PCC 7335]|nr:cell division topological specificity factor MinE, putative [Synechococcus sp. PCC 7335]
MAIPIISDLLEKFFGPPEDSHSRDDVKRRLKFVLAHDRLALDPQTLEMMRQEIIAVVSRYVEIDFDSLEFSLGTDQRMTTLTANLPIRRIRSVNRGLGEPIDLEVPASNVELTSQSETKAAGATVDKVAPQKLKEENLNESDLNNQSLDIDRTETSSEPNLPDNSNSSDSEVSDLELSDSEPNDPRSGDLSSNLEVDNSALDDSALDDSELNQSKREISKLDDSSSSNSELDNLASELPNQKGKPEENNQAKESTHEVSDTSILEASDETTMSKVEPRNNVDVG